MPTCVIQFSRAHFNQNFKLVKMNSNNLSFFEGSEYNEPFPTLNFDTHCRSCNQPFDCNEHLPKCLTYCRHTLCLKCLKVSKLFYHELFPLLYWTCFILCIHITACIGFSLISHSTSHLLRVQSWNISEKNCPVFGNQQAGFVHESRGNRKEQWKVSSQVELCKHFIT